MGGGGAQLELKRLVPARVQLLPRSARHNDTTIIGSTSAMSPVQRKDNNKNEKKILKILNQQRRWGYGFLDGGGLLEVLLLLAGHGDHDVRIRIA